MKKFLSFFLLLVVSVAFLSAGGQSGDITVREMEREPGEAPLTWYESRTASQLGITKFNEAPMLKAKVDAGELDPVEDRLPDDPPVLEPLSEIGTYGGIIRTSNNTSAGWSDLGHVRLSYLFTTDPGCSAVIPDVAKGYDLSDDGKVLTIYLREGLKWSDGAPLTADDFMFYYHDIMLNQEINYWTIYVWTIGGEPAVWEKINDYAFKITMAIPYRPVLSMLNHWYTLPIFFVQPKHYAKQFHIDYNPKADELAKELGHENWIDAYHKETNIFPATDQMKKVPTVGPWVMEEDVQLKKTYMRNPFYHWVDTEGNQLPYINGLEVHVVSSQEVTILDTIQGKNDVAGRLLKQSEFQLYKQYEDQGKYTLREWQKIYAADPGITFNQNHEDANKKELFQNLQFRQAMSLAINRSEMNDLLFLGMAIPQQATIHYGAAFYKEEWATNYADYDPAGAEALLDEINLKKGSDGYRRFADGTLFTLNMDVGETVIDAAELLKDYWEAVGVKVDLKTLGGELISQRLNANQFDVRISRIDRMLELRSYVPDSTPFDINSSVWATKWSDWIKWNEWNTTGQFGDEPPKGEEPPQIVKDYYESYINSLEAVSDEDYLKFRGEVWQFFSDYMPVIGTVAWPVSPVIVSKRLQNVLDTAIFSDDLSWFKVSQPAQWYIEE